MNSLNFNIFVSTVCNLKCSYCYENIDDTHTLMTIETADKVIEFIICKFYRLMPKKIYITFHGGEPLVGINIINYMIDELNSKIRAELYYRMTTNATLYKKSMLPTLKKIHDLSISIDGEKKTHDANRIFADGGGTFDIVIANLKTLLDEKIELTARLVITSTTYKEIYDNFVFLVECGVRKFSMELDFTTFTWSEEQISEYIILAKKILDKINELQKVDIFIETGLLQNGIKKSKNYLCDGGIGTFSILASGAVYPCTISVNNKRFCMGTVFGQINSDIVDEIQKMGSKSISKCEGCSRYDYCISTRCRMVNKVLLGDYLEPSPINCAIQRISMELSKYALEKSYKIWNTNRNT